jgi:hypothetical protein
MCLEDFFPLHVLLPRVRSRPPSRSQPCLPVQRKVNLRCALVEASKEKPQLPLQPIHGLGHLMSGRRSAPPHEPLRQRTGAGRVEVGQGARAAGECYSQRLTRKKIATSTATSASTRRIASKANGMVSGSLLPVPAKQGTVACETMDQEPGPR